MSARRSATVLMAAIVVLLVACAPAAPAPTPTAAPKAAASPPAAKTVATPVAKTVATPAAKPSPTPAAKEAAKPSPLEQLIEAARKDGAVRVNLSGDLGDKGAQRLVEAFKKKYNLNLKVDITLASSMRTSATQVLMEQRTGVEPSWDVVHGMPGHFIEMIRSGLAATYDWRGTFPDIAREMVFLDGAYLVMDAAAHVPAYNPNLVKPGDIPRQWEDFLDPKWKGNLVHHNTADIYARLAEKWGEQKATTFVEAMARQEPVFAQAYQVVPKITSGEYPLVPHIMDAGIFLEQDRGAPIRPIEDMKPIVLSEYGLAIPKKAKNPNAAVLFSGFQLSPEAQQIWWEEIRRGAPFGVGPKAQWLKGKDVFLNSLDFQLGDEIRLDQKFRKILGLQ